MAKKTGKCRIELWDTIDDIIRKLSEGSKDAAIILGAAVDYSPRLDPSSLYREYTPLINCDAMKLYGKHIVSLFEKVCHQRIDFFVAILRAVQLKIVTKPQLKRVMFGKETHIDLNGIFEKLTEKVPDFHLEQQSTINMLELTNSGIRAVSAGYLQ